MHFEENCFQCKSVDFLLFSCPKCLHKYCPSHRHFFDHECSNTGQNDEAVDREKKLIGKQACSFEACPQVDILTSTCSDCELVFCLKHRLDVDHECVKSTRKMAKLVNHPVGTSPGNVSKSRKPNPKLDLMKLKLIAKGKGTIRMEDRAYFSVSLPNGKSEALFVNQVTQIGKFLDQIASSNGIVNQNNRIDPGDEEYLALYSDLSNESLPMDATLVQLFENQVLYNGCTISLRRRGKLL